MKNNTPKKYRTLALTLFLLAYLFLSNLGLRAQTTVTFDVGGLTTWTVPAGVTSVTVECWGGGGAGGEGAKQQQNIFGGGGGGGGSYSKIISIPVTETVTYDVFVGTGGVNGANGGDSYFINTSTILANGGQAGTNASSGSNGTKGIGGAASAFGGLFPEETELMGIPPVVVVVLLREMAVMVFQLLGPLELLLQQMVEMAEMVDQAQMAFLEILLVVVVVVVVQEI